MEIVLVHGFRGDAEGLLGVGVELGRILGRGGGSGRERGAGVFGRGGGAEGVGVFGRGGSERGVEVFGGERSVEEYSSGDIMVEDLTGKYAGKRVKYAGGEIFLPELPPFGGAGEMSKYLERGGDDGVNAKFKVKRDGGGMVSKKVKHKQNGDGEVSVLVTDGVGKNFNDKRDGVSKKFNDRRNRGDEYSAEGYAEFLRGFIEEYGLKKPVLVGHSMGSLVVAATAERYPELVNKKIVLLAPISTRTSKFFTQLAPLVTLLPNKVVGWVTTRFLWVGGKRVLEEDLAERLGGEGSGLPERAERGNGLIGEAGRGEARSAREIYREALRLTYAGGGKYASKAAVRAATRFSTGYAVGDFDLGAGGVARDFKQGRAGARKEVLLLAGEKDRLIPRRRTEELARERGWRVEFVAGAGHLLNYERAGEVAKIITGFLESA